MNVPAGLGHPVATSPQPWRRLHPASPLVRVGRAVAALILAAAVNSSQLRHSGAGVPFYAYAYGGVIVLALVLGFVNWLVTRWKLEGDTLYIDTGLLRRDSRRLPVARIQAVDLVQPLLGRIFGVAEVRIRLAGAGGSRGRLAYLAEAEANDVRARLLAAHHGLDQSTPPPPEEVMLAVPPRRLLASVAVSLVGGPVGVYAVVLIVLAFTIPLAAAGVGAIAVPIVFGLLQSVWTRVTSEYNFTLADAPDGLRVRGGLLQTTAETIPRGRIQAVRQIEPLWWRPFGWRRLEVDVAGGARNPNNRRNNTGRVSRALLPVGFRGDAEMLLTRVLGAHDVPLTKPPTRARLKSPLGYHFLAAGHDDRHVVTVNGRVRKTTCWVPLEKVQSIRHLEGPVQRRVSVASVHLDTAGRRVRAVMRDRDSVESVRLVEELTDRCRKARASDGPPQEMPNA